MAVLFGSMIHDYEHTGHTNSFHVQSGLVMIIEMKLFRSNFSMLYNDRSVLENHHVSACFRLLKDEDKNLFEHLSRDEFRLVLLAYAHRCHREFRNMVIEIVLATDMSTHFVQIKTMKNMLSLPEGYAEPIYGRSVILGLTRIRPCVSSSTRAIYHTPRSHGAFIPGGPKEFSRSSSDKEISSRAWDFRILHFAIDTPCT